MPADSNPTSKNDLSFERHRDDFHVLRLLGNGQISAGKAAELLCALQRGEQPVFPNFEAEYALRFDDPLIAALRNAADHAEETYNSASIAKTIRQAIVALTESPLHSETGGEHYDPEYKLPCEVRLPIGMSIGKGVHLRTLMIAFKSRENWPDEDTRFQDERAKAIQKALGGASPSYPAAASIAHLSPENAQRVLDRHMRWRETALGFFRQILDGRGTEDEWPALAEFVHNSTTVPLLQSSEKSVAPRTDCPHSRCTRTPPCGEHCQEPF